MSTARHSFAWASRLRAACCSMDHRAARKQVWSEQPKRVFLAIARVLRLQSVDEFFWLCAVQVRALAANLHVSFMALSGAHIYSPYVGEAERSIRAAFTRARKAAPSVLFLDEVQFEGKVQGGGGASRLFCPVLVSARALGPTVLHFHPTKSVVAARPCAQVDVLVGRRGADCDSGGVSARVRCICASFIPDSKSARSLLDSISTTPVSTTSRRLLLGLESGLNSPTWAKGRSGVQSEA